MRNDLLTSCLSTFFSKILKIRYCIEVKGIENIPQEGSSVLFLANHPALIDPVILSSLILKRTSVRALMRFHIYRTPLLHMLFRRLKIISIPKIEKRVTRSELMDVKKSFQKVLSAMRKGDNFLIYPAGKIRLRGSKESVGGNSFIHDLLQEMPEAKVILVRSLGLWGSQSSSAITKDPSILFCCLGFIWLVLKNFFFFVPKRKVVVEFEKAPDSFHKMERRELNETLEEWYNRGFGPEGEPAQLVPSAFFSKKVPELVAEDKIEQKKESYSPETMSFAIKNVQAAILDVKKIKSEDLTLADHLFTKLGIDSLEMAQIISILGIEDNTMGKVETVYDLAIECAFNATCKKEKLEESGWKEERQRPAHFLPDAKSIPEAFLKKVRQMERFEVAADARMGVKTYGQMRMSTLVLALVFGREFKEKRVGVMLPSSLGAYLIILALQMSGKSPVMINWTAGKIPLATAGENVQKIITSKPFLDRLLGIDLSPIEDKLLFLEDQKKKISFFDKLRALYLSKMPIAHVLNSLSTEVPNLETEAVLLFTSGTESLPKGVPLSHGNILHNQKAALEVMDLPKDPIYLSILPPFHSFGFSATGLMPLLCGMRVYYSPDPKAVRTLLEAVDRWKCSVFIGTPVFIRQLFERKEGISKLKSLKLLISGAEKAPDNLKDYAKEIGADFIEGYGITECAPVVAVGRVGADNKGVGKPLPGTKIRIIDDEICICSPSVFAGYSNSKKNPFIEIEGMRFYRSGDKGFLDKEGHLVIAGRLSRFVKIGGEMLSLVALELALSKAFDTEMVAIGVEEGIKSFIVLFSQKKVSTIEVNNYLRQEGWALIAKIKEVIHLKEPFPLTGTGKLHYHALFQSIPKELCN